jgi:stearoyl-CoA 9-desaturase NADPH oxidoreductase
MYNCALKKYLMGLAAVKSFWHRFWRLFCLMLGNQPTLGRYFLPLAQLLAPGLIPGQYRARLLHKHWQTADMLYLTLSVSRRWPGFIPGQHIMLTVQHNGRYLSRPFSICSSIADWQRSRHISLCCKVSSGAEFTPLLNSLTPHCQLSVSKAQGEFSWQHPATPAVFIAAGSGVTPIAAMLLSQRHWLSPVTLHYRVRGEENAALLPQLKQLALRNSLFSLQLSNSRLEPGTDFCHKIAASVTTEAIYLCGPALFMQQLRSVLLHRGIAQSQLYSEQFTAANTATLVADASAQAVPTTFLRAGVPQHIIALRQRSLLQSAEQQGLNPSFGCRIGVCFQCVCEKVSGQVRDMRSGALSGHGREQIQLCISLPVSELVIKL